ncbi:MAG: methylmalonyl-CoA mutase metallochaperone MeaB [Bacteroidota bacterium]|nr:methylmalonyl-CoA mutase metallochaperone MeaB [Bacteroidota bacterium]
MQQKSIPSADYYINGILNKDRIILSKAITVIESTKPEDESLAEKIVHACLQTENISKRIAITGAPGAGKSTFINAFGKLLLDEKKSLAVLAVDPSSTISRGSILGDKTRMEDLVNDQNAFIRPTANSSNPGGVARNTRESILLCEAFGFDYIFIETVGVGQSETMVKNMSDLFLLLLLPNSGDELQGIKRGIMEMADIILINKSEKENAVAAKTAAAQVKLALHLYASDEKEMTEVLNISSTEKTGLTDLKNIIDLRFLKMETTGYLTSNRKEQELKWLDDTLMSFIKDHLNKDERIKTFRAELEQKIRAYEIDAYHAAKLLVQKLWGKDIT